MFSHQTYEVIKQRILDNTNINIDKREGSFVNNQCSPIAVELAKAYITMGDILSLGFIETNFDSFLDRRVNEFGVYRKEGKKATGEIVITGEDGAIINDGTIIKSNDMHFIVLNNIELPTENIAYVEALEVGYKYNLLANTNFELAEKNSKITSLVNKKDFEGGIDTESDDDLRKRYKKVVNNPSTSGNKAHYEQWALEVQGVGRAIVYPLWDKNNGLNGNGSVKVMIVGNDNKPVSQDIIDNTLNHLIESATFGPTITVTTPSILNVSISASVEFKEGFDVSNVKEEFETRLNDYIKDVTTELVYSKVYGVLINLEGVDDISSLKLNDTNNNITIPEDKIINISNIELSEVI